MWVFWWSADAASFQSIVHPGAGEGFVAIYPLHPSPEQRATRVAAVPRSDLPSACGVATAVDDGVLVTVHVEGGTFVVDTSTPAPPGTRTPPWELAPSHLWVPPPPPPTAFGRVYERAHGWERIVLVALTVVMGAALLFAGYYLKALNSVDGDRGEAARMAVIVVAVVAVIVIISIGVEHFGKRGEKDAHDGSGEA